MNHTLSRRWWGHLLLATVLAVAPALLQAAESLSPHQIISRLDQQYYYPQRAGLTSLSVRIHWAELDPSSDSDEKNFLNNPPVKFTWSANKPKGEFKLDTDSPPSLETARILRFFQNYRETFLPLTLAEKLEGYDPGNLQQQANGWNLRYSTNSVHNVRQYDFQIDPQRWRIASLNMKLSHEPFQVDSRLAYVQRGKQWQVVESRSRFSVSGNTFEENTRWTYGRIKGYWLPTKVVQEIHQGTSLARSTVFTLSDHRVR